jgi:hypothetical protein
MPFFPHNDDGARLWLNRQEIFDDENPRTLGEIEDRIPVHLKAGENELLLRGIREPTNGSIVLPSFSPMTCPELDSRRCRLKPDIDRKRSPRNLFRGSTMADNAGRFRSGRRQTHCWSPDCSSGSGIRSRLNKSPR